MKNSWFNRLICRIMGHDYEPHNSIALVYGPEDFARWKEIEHPYDAIKKFPYRYRTKYLCARCGNTRIGDVRYDFTTLYSDWWIAYNSFKTFELPVHESKAIKDGVVPEYEASINGYFRVREPR